MIQGKSMRSLHGKGKKAVLRGEIIAYASAKKRQREQFKKELELQIKLLKNKHKLNPNSNINTQLKKKRSDIAMADQTQLRFWHINLRSKLVNPTLLE